MRLWSKGESPGPVYIGPYQEMVGLRVKEWKVKFGSVQGKGAPTLVGCYFFFEGGENAKKYQNPRPLAH